MKIAKQDYKHIASLGGILLVVVSFFAMSKMNVEHDIAAHEKQVKYCKSDISSDEYQRYNCPEILIKSY